MQTCQSTGEWNSGVACSGSTATCSAGNCIANPYSRTVAIDGINDFSSDETFLTTSPSYTGYISWDAQYIYLGMSGNDIGTHDFEKKIVVYFGGSPGTTTGMAINTQQAILPFEAKYCVWYQTNNELLAWQYGSTWGSVPWPFVENQDWKRAYYFVEFRIPRSTIGAASTVNLHMSMVNSVSGSEWSYAGVPSTTFDDGFDPNFGAFFHFDLTSSMKPSSYAPSN